MVATIVINLSFLTSGDSNSYLWAQKSIYLKISLLAALITKFENFC